jgi:hypothetical protein
MTSKRPIIKGMKYINLLILSILFSSLAWAIAPNKAESQQMPMIAPAPAGDPNAATKHANAMGFANKGVKWGILRSLIKDAKGKPVIKDPELKAIVGKEISLKGYMLPLDFSKKQVAEFLLLPYIPSCMHVPPPPSTQIIHVKMNKGAKAEQSYFPVEVTGKLTIVENKEYESSYQMAAKKTVIIDPAKENKKKKKKSKVKKKKGKK